jgi:prepilin-type N-terminal cleavage/methylation domain-containing protein
VRQRVGGLRAGHGDHEYGRGQAGFTLVEMMVAIFILGVLLAASASAFIGFSRQAVLNERRVQATALLNRLHEELQTIPWDQAALYEDELGPLVQLGADLAVNPPTLDGDSLVLLDPPDNSDCPIGEPECGRHPLVPLTEESLVIDGRDYSVLQAVTWVDRNEDGVGDVKRFTTAVAWSVLGRDYVETFQSERAPTAAEVAVVTPPEVIQFSVTPESPALDDDGVLVDELVITARFDRGITAAEVSYQAIAFDGTVVERELTLAPELFEASKPIAFEGTIAAGTESFAEGLVSFTLTGFDVLATVGAVTSVDFMPPGADPPPVITSLLVTRATVNVGTSGGNAGKLRCAVSIEATVDGLDAGGNVTLSYTSIVSEGITMDPPGTITGTNDLFRWTFNAGATSPWSPPTTEQFIGVARTGAGRSSAGVTSTPTLTVNAANGAC